MLSHSKPIVEKTPEITESGYEESAFGENYWLVPDASGRRRIDRGVDNLVKLIGHLVERELLPVRPRVLDVGAGPGGMVRQIRAAGYETDGCEFSESGRRIALEQFGIELKPCDLREGLPYGDGEYDLTLCIGVLTMVPRGFLKNALSEILRVTKPGGVAHLHLMNPRDVEEEPHLTRLPQREWWRLVREAGFEDVTSVAPPQRFGVGVNRGEFSGVFRRP